MIAHDWTRVEDGTFHHFHGAWIFELAVAPDRKAILEQAAKARERLESLLHIGDEMLGMDEA